MHHISEKISKWSKFWGEGKYHGIHPFVPISIAEINRKCEAIMSIVVRCKYQIFSRKNKTWTYPVLLHF